MNQSIETRMDSIEQQLKELRKEMEESVARYKLSQYPWSNGDFPKQSVARDTKCLWDSIPIEDRMKPMGLSCSCRKCSAYC